MASWDAKDVPAALMEAAEKADRAERREYIATAVLAGIAHKWADPGILAKLAVDAADALIAELNK